MCNLERGELALTESISGNVGLAVALELGVGYICCSATDFPPWASYLVICFPSLHQQITISPNEIK